MTRIPTVTGPVEEQLSPRKLTDYSKYKENLLQWLSNFGKNPAKREGYADETVRNVTYHVDRFYRWKWETDGGYTISITPEEADDLGEGVLMLPADVQKDYPNDNSPEYTEIELADETVRTLRQYLNTRWRESSGLFPSRQSEYMTTQSVRNVVRDAAEVAEIRPYTVRGRDDQRKVTPYVLRHSVAYRMLNRERGNTLYDVTKRLRHATILTTERVYTL